MGSQFLRHQQLPNSDSTENVSHSCDLTTSRRDLNQNKKIDEQFEVYKRSINENRIVNYLQQFRQISEVVDSNIARFSQLDNVINFLDGYEKAEEQ